MKILRSHPGYRVAAAILLLSGISPARADEAPSANLPQDNAPAWQRIDATEMHMGTAFQMAVYAHDAEFAREALAAAYARVAALNAALSDYDPDSELSRLSRAAPTSSPTAVSDDLFRVLQTAQQVSQQSQGAFDVTVGPLSRLWRRARRQRAMPSSERLEEALQAVGYQAVVLDAQRQMVSLQRANMRLDLGGIAKGFAADEALGVLRQHGFPRALVNAGGDVAIGAPPPGQMGWTIGIEALDPDQPAAEAGLRQIQLARTAIATSGDTWQYVEIEGVRYSHILDPRTGLGMTRRSSVTVLAANGMHADAYASALSVMEVEPGLALIERLPMVEAQIVWREGDCLQRRASSGFPEK